MSEHYPRIRIHAESGALLIREALSFTFYIRRDHADIAPAVMSSLRTYLHAVGGHRVLSRYSEEVEGWLELDEPGWALVQQELLNHRHAIFDLRDASSGQKQYRFEYQGRPLGSAPWGDAPEMVCAVSFWLPTEYLEEHGPGQVRELALQLATPLPFTSGHAGLAFNCDIDLVGVEREAHKLCFRHPGMDIPKLGRYSRHIGTKVRGPFWMTFLGQPVLGALEGTAGLRSRIHSPATTVQEMDGERAVITLGQWPEAGDSQRSAPLLAYRELAHILEPWLYHEPPLRGSAFTPEDMLRWERRFLD
jgi:Protein of unknown function (DUF3396)